MSELNLFIIRHAEKPEDSCTGTTEGGAPDKHSLIVRGWQRAGAWASLFGSGLSADYPKPIKIFASKPNSQSNPGASSRPYETVLPLARRIGLTKLDTTFIEGQEPELVRKLLGLSGDVLLAWEHKAIAGTIVPKLDVARGTPPKKWPGNRFDVVLRFHRSDAATKFAFTMLFPKLLDGDSDTWP